VVGYYLEGKKKADKLTISQNTGLPFPGSTLIDLIQPAGKKKRQLR